MTGVGNGKAGDGRRRSARLPAQRSDSEAALWVFGLEIAS